MIMITFDGVNDEVATTGRHVAEVVSLFQKKGECDVRNDNNEPS